MSNPRIDKWLWMVRLFKTRSKAAEACRKGRVRINGKEIKPAHELKPDEVMEVKFVPIWRRYIVKGFPKSRVGAAFVSDYLTETTPAEEIERWEEYKVAQKDQFLFSPERGRPTKKDRRKIDRFKSDD